VDNRCAQILNIIRERDAPITVKELAETFKVSQRTIRYDLNKIDSFLQDCHLPQLQRKPNSGVQIELSHAEQMHLSRKLLGMGTYHYTLSPEERRRFILIELIASKGYVTIQSLAEKLSVSRSTVITDLRELRHRIKEHGVTIESKTKEGIRIVGEEKKLRKILMDFIFQYVDTKIIVREIQEHLFKDDELGLEMEFRNLLADMDLHFIEKCLQVAEQELNVQFSDDAYSGIILHIAMALKRIQLGHDIVIPKEELKMLASTKEFSTASGLAQMLEEHFHLNIPIDEIGYMTMHMLGASNFKNNKEDSPLEYQIIVQAMVGTMSGLTGVNLSRDPILIQGLEDHIGPVIHRLQHELHVKNPLLKEIETNYHDLFHQTKMAVRHLEIFTRSKMPPDEIGFIALHFAAALERLQTRENSHTVKDILIVCGTGIGTAEILSAKLKKLFKVNIINCISSHHLESFIRHHHVELIISMIKLPHLSIPAVVVNPLLNDQDILKLSPYLERRTIQEHGDLQTIIKIIEENCRIINRGRLEKELIALLDNQKKEVEEELMLKDLLTEDVIEVQVEVDDWEEAVRYGGNLLVNTCAAKESYVSAMIESVKTIGPYIVIAPGIAMPHARPEAGALKTGFSLITLKEPVCFGNKENDPVYIVACICSTDHTSHVKALSELVNLFGNEENIHAIREASSVHSILQLIQ